MEERIRGIVKEGLLAISDRHTDFGFSVERPTDLSRGDYAVNAAMVSAKGLGMVPKELAEKLKRHLEKSFDEDIKSVEVAGPGFINITLSKGAVARAIEEAQNEKWGKGKEEAKQKVMIEYGNPNPFKEMHIGHLIGSIIGEALSRLIENEGAKVLRDTFGGDIGPHVAKTIWALQKRGVKEPENAKEIGEAYAEGSRAYEADPAAQTEIDALNQEIYAGKNSELMELWRTGREISMEEFRRIWKILGTHFDYELYDSDTTEGGLRLVRDGLKKGVFAESDGAIIYKGDEKKVHTMVFITGHGTPTYEAKDIGLAFLREEKCSTNRVIILTGQEQVGRFKTVLAALAELAPLLAAKTRHIAHGFLTLTTGKMSSREGNVITATALLEDVMKRASAKNADPLIAEQVAVGAVKYMILRQASGSDIIFDPEKSLSLEGDSGPYLQYALVRARKILSYASDSAAGTEVPEVPYDIERLIVHYPEVAARAARELAPNLLTTYLTELAGEWNSFYAKEQVLGSPEEAYKQKVAKAFANTMKHGLHLLGIPTPEKM